MTEAVLTRDPEATPEADAAAKPVAAAAPQAPKPAVPRRKPASHAGWSSHPEVPAKQQSSPYRPRPDTEASATPEEPAEARPQISEQRRFNELVRRASEGNEACLAGLKKMLDERPEIWQSVGNVSSLAEKAWLELVAGQNALVQQAIPRQLAALKSELVGSRPTAVEKLLVDMIGVQWVAANHAEYEAAASGLGVQQMTLRQKCAESANKRFLASITTLAKLRALVPKGLVPLATDVAPGESTE